MKRFLKFKKTVSDLRVSELLVGEFLVKSYKLTMGARRQINKIRNSCLKAGDAKVEGLRDLA